MSSFLKISVRFLLDEFDGRSDSGEPEWPPSPLRLFQTLTNSAARLGMDAFASSLKHLEKFPPPLIVASKRIAVQSRRSGTIVYVPNNDGDLWFDKSDKSGGKRVEKKSRPTRLPENAAVHYLWAKDDDAPHQFIEEIQQLARSISAFGWGVNMVIGDAETVKAESLPDPFENLEKWLPSRDGNVALRIPVTGTLDALEARHKAFLGRLSTDEQGNQFFSPVPPLETFHVVTYRRETDPARPPHAVFALREPDDSKFLAFDPKWRRLHLTGMLRHAASRPDFAAALGWDIRRVGEFVLGHDKSGAEQPTTSSPRLMFIPLPSVEWRGEKRGETIGAIRRVLVTTQGPQSVSEFERIARTLEGRELIDEKSGQSVGFLRRQSPRDAAIGRYFDESATWTTTTPVVLPGYDDPRKLRSRLRDAENKLTAAEKAEIVRRLDARIEKLLRKSLLDTGIPPALARHAGLEWRGTGFLPGVDLASSYSVPDQCRRFRRLHVRLTWREVGPDGTLRPKKMRGPFCIGSGRFSGLGLFVPCG